MGCFDTQQKEADGAEERAQAKGVVGTSSFPVQLKYTRPEHLMVSAACAMSSERFSV